MLKKPFKKLQPWASNILPLVAYIDRRTNKSSSFQNPFTIAIEGNIGCGKTLLLSHFESWPIAQVYAEPVNKWRNIQGHNALAMLYSNPSRWAMSSQMYILLTMLQTHLASQNAPVKLMERSIYSVMYCFVENQYKSGLLNDFEYIILSDWFANAISDNQCTVHLTVYLRTSPEIVMNRILRRARSEENKVKLTFLQSLHDRHEQWLSGIAANHANVLVIDADRNKNEMKWEYENLKQIIVSSLKTRSLTDVTKQF